MEADSSACSAVSVFVWPLVWSGAIENLKPTTPLRSTQILATFSHQLGE
jgi:hypothetical protein